MGINADGSALESFNPYGLVSRAEFATVFSRVLFGSKYNTTEWNYYDLHLAALKEAGILSNDTPTIQEVRGWVMLMMYRSAQEKATATEEATTEENKEVEATTWATAEATTWSVAETTTSTTAEEPAADASGAVAEAATWATAGSTEGTWSSN